MLTHTSNSSIKNDALHSQGNVNDNLSLKIGSKYDTVQKDRDKSKFQPNVKLLYRITKALMDNNSLGKTALSQKANINYVILMKHLSWLEEKKLLESVINDGKIHVKFREEGRQFAEQIINLVEGELDFIKKE